MVASASRRYRRARAREAHLATQSAAGQHNATSSRMHALPTEISQQILRYTLTDEEIAHDPTNALPLIRQYHVLRRVCWKWNREMPWVLQEWRRQRACVVSKIEHRVGYPRIGLLGPPERERRWIQMRSEMRRKGKKKGGGQGGGLNAEAQASPERLMNGAGYEEIVEEQLARFKIRRKRKHRKYMIKMAKWKAAERKAREEKQRTWEEERRKWEEEHKEEHKEEIMEQQRQSMEKRYRESVRHFFFLLRVWDCSWMCGLTLLDTEQAKKKWRRAMNDTVQWAEEKGVEWVDGEEQMSDTDWLDSGSNLSQSWMEHDEEYLGHQEEYHY